MKKALSFILAVTLIISALPLVLFVSAMEVGDVGEEGYYSYYMVADGEVMITYVNENLSGYVVIPDTLGGYPVTAIGNPGFMEQRNITGITLSENIKTIDDWSFSACSGLTEILIPKNVESIGKNAFSNCTNLKKITVDENNNYYCDIDDVLYNKDKTQLEMYPTAHSEYYTIPYGVTSIATGGFYYSDVTSVTIPNSVTSIGDQAFWGCDGITDVWYTGSKEEKSNISIGYSNDPLLDATWHYNSCPAGREHTYDGVTDTECNECGAQRQFASGDINADGQINNKDLGLLMQYLNNWDVEIVTDAADVNGDSSVNNKDYGLLMQYLNNWDVDLVGPGAKPDENPEVTVVDALNYSKNVIPIPGFEDWGYEEMEHRVILPKITSETENAKAFNQKMYDTFSYAYDMLINNEERGAIYDIDYEYKIDNGVIGIFITNRHGVQAGGITWFYEPFYYDIENDKEITLDEYVAAFGFTVPELFELIKTTDEYKFAYEYAYGEISIRDCIIDDTGLYVRLNDSGTMDGWSELEIPNFLGKI